MCDGDSSGCNCIFGRLSSIQCRLVLMFPLITLLALWILILSHLCLDFLPLTASYKVLANNFHGGLSVCDTLVLLLSIYFPAIRGRAY